MRRSLSCTFSLITLLFTFLSPPTPAHAAEKMQIAVLDLQPKGVSKVVAGGVTDLLRAHLVDVGVFTVVERGQMSEILKEQGFQMTGCTDQACAVQVGQLLSANKILVGEVTRLGNSILITVRIVDVEKGVGEYATRETAANEDLLEEATEKLSKKLIERITGKSMAELFQEFEVETRTGYYLRSIVPGWGQFYAGKSWKGYVFSSVFVVAAAFSTYAVMDYGKKKKDYDDLPYGTPESEFDAAYDEYQKAGNMTLMSFGILGAVYLAHWADILFFSRPDFEKKESAGTWKRGLYLNIYTDAGSPLLPERRTTLAITMRF
jgi:TolB-like protein